MNTTTIARPIRADKGTAAATAIASCLEEVGASVEMELVGWTVKWQKCHNNNTVKCQIYVWDLFMWIQATVA